MALELLSSVRAKLTSLLERKAFLRGLGNDFLDINSSLNKIESPYYRHLLKHHSFPLWKNEVDAALRDTNKLLDVIETEIQPEALWKRNKLRQKERRFFRYRHLSAFRLKIGPKIKATKARLSSLAKEAEDLGLIKRDHPVETPISAKRGFKKDLFDINSSVSAIKDVLPIAEKRSVHSKPVKDWLRKADDAFCDVDKLLYRIHTEEQKMALWRRKIKAIKARLSSIQNEAKKLGLVKHDHCSNVDDNDKEGGSSGKIKTLLIVNFGLELLSAIFDQLSSVDTLEFALAAMLIALVGFLICTAELAYKGKKEKARLRWHKGIPWFYCPTDTPTTYRRLGNFAEMFGLGSAILQSFTAIVTYVFYSHHSHNPIQMNLWTILFGFCVMLSRFLKDRCPKVSLLQADENV